MAKFYEVYKSLIVAITLTGVYFSSIEKIYGKKFYTKFLKVFHVVPYVFLPVHTLAAIKYQMFDANDEKSKIFGCTVTVFSSFLLFTFFSFHYLRHDFERLFEMWDSMFQEELFPENRQELLRQKAKMTISWLKRFGGVIIGSCVGYCLFVYLKPSKKLNHPSGIPYRHQSPDFELVNTLDLITSYFGCGGLIAFDSMTLALLSMEEAQLQHLKVSLAWIVDTVSVTGDGNVQIKSVGINDADSDDQQKARAFDEVRKQVKIWISHHQQVLRLHNEFQKAYSIPLSTRFSYFVLILCLSCFVTLMGMLTPLDIAFVILYCFSNYTIFYVNVMCADEVAEVANTIFGDAFAKSWHTYPRDLKTVFHIIQMQSNRPLQYVAFKKYSLSSSSFLKILSSAYSLFTFLLQVNRKKFHIVDSQASSDP